MSREKLFNHLWLFVILVGSFLIGKLDVFATTGEIKTTLEEGEYFLGDKLIFDVNLSCSDILGTWQFKLEYDEDVLELVSGDKNVVGYSDGTYNTKTYSYEFLIKGVGDASIKFKDSLMVGWNDEELFTPTVTEVPMIARKLIKGDLDKNGRITIKDAVEVLYYVVGRYEITSNTILWGDISGDGKITILDALATLKSYIS